MPNTVAGESDPGVLGDPHALCLGMKHRLDCREVWKVERQKDQGKMVEIVEGVSRSAVGVDHGNP